MGPREPISSTNEVLEARASRLDKFRSLHVTGSIKELRFSKMK